MADPFTKPLREAIADYLFSDHIELLGATYPARKEGSKFFLPVDCPVVAGQRIYHEGAARYVLSVKRTPHAVIVDTDLAR